MTQVAHLCTLFLDTQLSLKGQSHQHGGAFSSQMDRTEVHETWRQQEDLRSLGRVMGILKDGGEFRGTLRDL